MRMKFRLFGAHAGSTIVLCNTFFENGLAAIDDTPENLGHLERALRFYRAYSEGSAEYDAAVEEESNGNRSKADPETGSGDSERLLGEHDSSSGGVTDEGPTQRSTYANGETGDARSGSNGSGHEDSGMAERETAGDQGSGESDQISPDPNALDVDWKLVNIVEALDPTVDDHWTQAGLPAIAAIEQAYGSGEVTRALVEQAKPGWNRESAQQESALISAVEPEETEDIPF